MSVLNQEDMLPFRNEIEQLFDGSFPLIGFANDWHGDPTSKHHIVSTYSHFTDALWVEASGMRRPQLSSGMDRSRIAGRLARSFGGPRRVSEDLHVLSPLSLPLPGSRAAQALNRELYRWTLKRAQRTLGWDQDPLLWVYIPTVAPYLSRIRRRGLVYHCVDRWWAFSDYDTEVMKECHARLCREADIVFASSAELLDECTVHTPHAHLIRPGVEGAFCSRRGASDEAVRVS
ncbi:MAG: hypothetical protein H0U67_01675 [Gemmatimonadetes bacterium]|nr:hypothetical protein [Gemmatimonadota bacterium]